MCGICGCVCLEQGNGASVASVVTTMAKRLSHRGPDASGIWSDSTCGVALGHTRLSIIDLSPLGSQPMRSTTGRFVIVLNGEIYNFQELRSELAHRGHR